jgi:hypothetical protein
MPALLLVWLSFSCQNCFADSETENAQKLHAAMDCCPSTAHTKHAQADMFDGQGCDTNYLINQPMLADEGTMAIQLADFVDVLLPVAEARFASVYPSLIQPPGVDKDPQYFSDRLFSSYRILLI